MNAFSLWFASSGKGPELSKTEFLCEKVKDRLVCFRGTHGSHTFRWTRAIKRISALFVRYALGCSNSPPECGLLIDHDISDKQTVLFVHERFLRNARQAAVLDSVIRDAWLSLLESSSSLMTIVDQLISDTTYLKYLRRFSGMHNKPNLLETFEANCREQLVSLRNFTSTISI